MRSLQDWGGMHSPSLILYERAGNNHCGIPHQEDAAKVFIISLRSVHFCFDHLGLELSLIGIGQDNTVL